MEVFCLKKVVEMVEEVVWLARGQVNMVDGSPGDSTFEVLLVVPCSVGGGVEKNWAFSVDQCWL